VEPKGSDANVTIGDTGTLDARSESRLNRAIMSGRILGLALSMSVLAYILIGTLVAQLGPVRASVDNVRLALVGAGFAALIGSIVFRRSRLAPHRLEATYARNGDHGLIGYLLATTVVSAALAEVVGIAGLLLGILAGDTRAMNVFCVVALVAIIFSLPNAGRWREAYSHMASRGRVEAATEAGPAVRG
jgi:hypothetical protein